MILSFTGAFVVAAVASAALVFIPPLRSLLLRSAVGIRWRVDAVPVSGGLAIAAGMVAGAWSATGDSMVAGLLAAGAVGLAWGLLDDILTLRPLVKVIGQATAAVVVVATGTRLPVGGGEALEVFVTVVWVVAVANAVNLLDGMDGAAAGVGALIAGAVWWWWATGDGGFSTALPAAVAGALCGFLVLNRPPARIFMGDSGATMLGVVLAGLAAADGGRLGGADPAGVMRALLVPGLLIAVPLYDTLLVTVERLRNGRPVTQGGLDHTLHRLVTGGMAPSMALVVVWSATALAAVTAWLPRLGLIPAVLGVVLLLAALAALTRQVLKAEVYGDSG